MSRYPARGYTVLLNKEAVAASTWYILIDLDDTTNYHHGTITSVNILTLDIDAEQFTNGTWDIWVGVVLENDGTNGSAQWFKVFHFEHIQNSTDGSGRLTKHIDFTCRENPDGVCCAVGGGKTKFIAGPESGDVVALKNDAADLTNAGGGASKSAAVGDVVVWAELTGQGGNLHLSMTATYKPY